MRTITAAWLNRKVEDGAVELMQDVTERTTYVEIRWTETNKRETVHIEDPGKWAARTTRFSSRRDHIALAAVKRELAADWDKVIDEYPVKKWKVGDKIDFGNGFRTIVKVGKPYKDEYGTNRIDVEFNNRQVLGFPVNGSEQAIPS
jgi:hypothetical protein